MFAQRTTLIEIIETYWPVLACSFLVSAIATPLCRVLALRRKIVDRPDDFLKPHRAPVPYLGGVAIFLGWVAGVVLAITMFSDSSFVDVEPKEGPSMPRVMMVGILVGGTAIMLLGLLDDLRIMSPIAKLAGICAAALFLTLFGVGDDTILIALRSAGFSVDQIDRWLILAYSIPVSVIITVVACNATNLIDGVDGLCSGVLGIISAGFLVIAVHQHTWGHWRPGDVQRVVLALALMGAALGFLPYNRNPAKIFMGDAGSMLLGFNAAVLMLLFAKSIAVKWLIGSVMVFGLPLADLILTVARRWRNERPIMRGDRSHFYDQLLDRGWPVSRVVRVSYALAGFFAVMGCVTIALRTRYIFLLYAAVVAGIIIVASKMKMVRMESDEARELGETHKEGDNQTLMTGANDHGNCVDEPANRSQT